jgi:hypothetical protein
MRPSKLTNKHCFGPYHNNMFKLQLGDTQHMNFTDLDMGPFYFMKNEKEDRKLDGQSGKYHKRPILKENLVEMLKEKIYLIQRVAFSSYSNNALLWTYPSVFKSQS